MTHPIRKDGVLIVGGTSHDMDFVRLNMLTRLAVHDHLRMAVTADFETTPLLEQASFVIAYTCNVEPSERAAKALHAFVTRGGRLLALHATNALLDFTADGVAPRATSTSFMQTMGSQFMAHPPIGPFHVTVDDTDHPLTAGMTAFETTDELYLSDMQAPARVLLSTRFTGKAPGFTRHDWSDDAPRPVLYLHNIGKGEVAYFNLGHARGHYDAPHRAPYWPELERGSWPVSAFNQILDRTIRWAARIGDEMQ